MSNERVLVISLSDVGSDPRVDRQVEALLPQYAVTVAAFAAPQDSQVRFVSLAKPIEAPLGSKLVSQFLRFLRRFSVAYWRHPSVRSWFTSLDSEECDAILVNDTMLLPLALRLAGSKPVVFDAHEYAPSEHNLDWTWRIAIKPSIEWICRQYIPRTAANMVVSGGIGQLYERRYGGRFTTVTNAPRFEDLHPTPVGPGPIRLVHWGAADRQRRLELLIETLEKLGDGYQLDLILVPGDQAYIDELIERAQSIPTIRFLPRIPMRDLSAFGNEYDIGIFVLPDRHPNQKFTLPNKFFEFIQARLAIAIGPSPEMRRIAEQFDFGIIAHDFTAHSMADAIKSTSHQRLRKLKSNTESAALVLNASHNAELIRSVVSDALASKS